MVTPSAPRRARCPSHPIPRRCPTQRRRPQSPPRGRQRRDLRKQRLLRPPRPRAGALRNGAARAHRRPTHRRNSDALRRVAADLLQAQCRVRARGHLWPAAQEARSQGWPQATCRGHRGVPGGADAGPRRGYRLARGTREATIRRRDPRADDRTRAQTAGKKTPVSERAPGVGHERSRQSATRNCEAQRSG